MTQTRREIQATMAAAGIRPLKQLGQNFLIDGSLLHKLVAAAEIGPTDVVLEVGPGTGVLTEKLLESGGHVVAVEIDKTLQALCNERFVASGRFTLIHRDVLEKKSKIAPEVLGALVEKQSVLKGRILLVANLPYQIASPLIINLLQGDLRVSPMCFTVQAEVAERIMAPPGGKTYGPISIFCQALADIKRIARVPPTAFWPEPKVHSTMLRLDVYEERKLSPHLLATLSDLVHGCFGHRRKTMRSNLRTLLDEQTLQRVESDGRWDLAMRPEQWAVSQWIELAKSLNQRP